MQTLYKADVLSLIKKGQTFEGYVDEAGLYIRIGEYVPYVCTAIHAGHDLNQVLKDNCLISAANRKKEEDPYTDKLIDSFPIVLVAMNSRYEYDLNRKSQKCIYEEAWGETVWKKKLTKSQVKISKSKHDAYYAILKALLIFLEKKFGGSIIFDMHSFNWQIRKLKDAPVFNIGTHYIDKTKWNDVIGVLEQKLSIIDLPNIDSTTKRDAVFQGKGYQAEFVSKNFNNALLIPLEVKKIFMDEISGTLFPLVFDKLQEKIHKAIFETASFFNENLKKSKLSHVNLLISDIEPAILLADKALYKIAKNLETLVYVNPINIQQEKKKFLQQRNYTPNLKYKQLRINPYEFKEKLLNIPVSKILDPFVRSMYRSTIEAYATKIDMLTHIGSPQFLYNSLRYYGEPSKQDIQNANFLLHAFDDCEKNSKGKRYNAKDATLIFEKAANKYKLDCKIKESSKIVAKAMVDNSKKTLFINSSALLSEYEINSLIHHELGVHMVTTLNACQQPMKIFQLGLPGNTYTQEGLAIFSEYLSGNLNISRLKQLALRVIVVRMMIEGASFSTTFHFLLDEHQLTIDAAFTLCLRAYRGGGFTKDYLYLAGFRDIALMHKEKDISPLLIGKTGLKYLDTISSLIERGWIRSPYHIVPALKNNKLREDCILEYLIRSIKE